MLQAQHQTSLQKQTLDKLSLCAKEMASAITIIGILSSNILATRFYRSDVARADLEAYCREIAAKRKYQDSPCLLLEGVSHLSINRDQLLLVLSTTRNVNAAMAFEFLLGLYRLLRLYLGYSVKADTVRSNLPLVYELLEETMDMGIPQFTDEDVLDNLIVERKSDQSRLEPMRAITIGQSSAYHCIRSEQIMYKKNEMWIDQIEELFVQLSRFGELVTGELKGKVIVKARLSGIPECRMTFRKSIDLAECQKIGSGQKLQNLKLHQCVRAIKCDSNTRFPLCFIPPDGECQLISYSIFDDISLPFKLLANTHYNYEARTVDLRLNIRALFDRNCAARKIIVRIPLPAAAAQVEVHGLSGTVTHSPIEQMIQWRINSLGSSSQISLSCKIKMKSDSDSDTLNFFESSRIGVVCDLSGFPSSGMTLQALRIYDKSSYKATSYYRKLVRLTVSQRIFANTSTISANMVASQV